MPGPGDDTFFGTNNPDTDVIPYALADSWSQNFHVCGGISAVLVACMFGTYGVLVGYGILLVFAAIKEFWYDFNYETALVRGSSLEDFMHYELGGVLGVILHFVVPLVVQWVKHLL